MEIVRAAEHLDVEMKCEVMRGGESGEAAEDDERMG